MDARAGRGRRFALLRLLARIGNATVHHALECVPEALADLFELPQRDVAFLELPVRDPPLDHIGDKLIDLLRRDALEAARSAFNRVSKADDRAFPRLRTWSRIAKAFFPHFG